MALPAWKARFLGTTRGRILGLLRRGEATVGDLAERLELTDNAIRAHLAALERDALVEQHGLHRGIGKPAFVYRLTDDADRLFPKAYALVLNRLVARLRVRMGDEGAAAVLEEVGRDIAGAVGRQSGEPEERVRVAAAALEAIGGLAEVEERAGGFYLRGFTCPMSEVAGDHPQVCQLASALLEEMTGLRVREECDRTGRPMCRFTVEARANGRDGEPG